MVVIPCRAPLTVRAPMKHDTREVLRMVISDPPVVFVCQIRTPPHITEGRPNGLRLRCGALKKDSFQRVLGRWRVRISGRIGLQLVKQCGQRIAGWAIAPHDVKRRPACSRVVERSDEYLGDIRTGNSVTNRQRQRALGHEQRTLATRAVQQDPGSNDGVLEPARANRVLRPLAPHQGIAFVEIEDGRGPRAARNTTGCHVQKATAESHPLSRSQRIHDAAILGFSNVPLRRRAATPATSGKYHVRGALKGRGKRVWLRDVTGNELEGRSEPCPRALRVPGKDTDWYTLTLQGVRSEKARAPSTADYEDESVGAQELKRLPHIKGCSHGEKERCKEHVRCGSNEGHKRNGQGCPGQVSQDTQNETGEKQRREIKSDWGKQARHERLVAVFEAPHNHGY